MRSKTTALVLGASGMVGGSLCQSLLADGWKVYGAARFSDSARRKRLEATGVETSVFDALADDPRQLPDVSVLFLEVWDPRHIVGEHLEDCWALNFDAVGRVVQRYAGVADVVNGNTISLYGPRGDRPSLETDPPRPAPGLPDTEYALSRMAQERLIEFLCAGTRSRVFHLRYDRSNTETRGVLAAMARKILAGQVLGAWPDERIQVIGLRDFVRCTVLAADRLSDEPQAVNICHPRIWTMRELAERIRDGLGEGSVAFENDSGGVEYSIWADPSRMLQLFGQPVEDLDELIARVCASCRATDSSGK